MNVEQITAWAAEGESEVLVLKRGTGLRREAAQTVCAMLNHRGGRVLFGVEPDGRVVGQQVGVREMLLERLHADSRWELEPAAGWSVEDLDHEETRRTLESGIEAWGQGTLKMAAWALEAGLPKPGILEVPGAVVVRFRAKTTGKTPRAVLELLVEDPHLTVHQLAASLEKSELTIYRAIRTLREFGRLRRIGPAKGGHWEVIE